MTRRRRALGPYAGKTLVMMWRSLRLLLIVIIAAGSGLFLIQSVNEARHRADEERSNAFVIDRPLTDPALIGPLDRPALAMEGAVATVLAHPHEKRSFNSREALAAALLPHVTRSRHYPTVAAVLAGHQPRVRDIEAAIVAAGDEGQKRDGIRRRDFELDALRFELAALPERQREFVASAVDHLDRALAVRPQQGAKGKTPFGTFTARYEEMTVNKGHRHSRRWPRPSKWQPSSACSGPGSRWRLPPAQWSSRSSRWQC